MGTESLNLIILRKLLVDHEEDEKEKDAKLVKRNLCSGGQSIYPQVKVFSSATQL